jgi:hypothetical protein
MTTTTTTTTTTTKLAETEASTKWKTEWPESGKLSIEHHEKPERTNRSSGLIRNSSLLNKQMIIDNS